jgi:ATP-dependent DNA helicase RecG
LTLEQEKVLEMVRKDLERSYPMSRLLHGEVGSGKTILALLASAIVAFHGKQTVFLAPTELLAFQLERMSQELEEILNLRPACLTGGMPQRLRKELLERIKSGEANLILGTHAVLQKDVVFSGVGMVVVDEQHRFGVIQKATVQDKAHWPHMLVMSATPIPRALALSMYGDLDISTLRHALPGRSTVSTVLVPSENRQLVYTAVRREIEEGGSVYWVAPRIDAQGVEDMHSVEELFRHLAMEVFPDVTIASIHGNVPSDEKQKILEGFKEGLYKVLVATTVVEVGLDVPEATIIVVEHPECYGLAQLHQLRGRIGRGSRPGYCYLMVSKIATPLAQRRLEIFQNTKDGFCLAEEDLRLRGPGEFLGTRQSGIPALRIGDFFSHHEVLEQAQQEVNCLLQEDPHFQSPEYRLLLHTIQEHYGQRLALSQIC